jgi:hypothetical protein
MGVIELDCSGGKSREMVGSGDSARVKVASAQIQARRE